MTTVFSIFDEQIEWHTIGAELGFKPIYRGHEGVRDFWREWLASWDRVEFSYDEFIDGGEQVIVLLRQRARGKSSGIELSQEYVQMWTLSEGKIVRMEFFPTKQEALEAAGLSA